MSNSVSLWTVAHQTPLSMEISRQEYWIGLPFPSPGDLLNLGIEPVSSALAGVFFTTESPGSVSCSIVSDSATPWMVACQAPLSTEFSKQEYWSG